MINKQSLPVKSCGPVSQQLGNNGKVILFIPVTSLSLAFTTQNINLLTHSLSGI